LSSTPEASASDVVVTSRFGERLWIALSSSRMLGNQVIRTPFVKAAMQIHEGIQTADSIDDFIDRAKNRPDGDKIELCGKLGIVRSILNYEGKVILV
jgi:hypothetical protein